MNDRQDYWIFQIYLSGKYCSTELTCYVKKNLRYEGYLKYYTYNNKRIIKKYGNIISIEL